MKLTFADAIKLAFKNYFTFSGRSTRREYWWFILFYMLVSVVASSIDYAMGGKNNQGFVGSIVGFALFIPMLTLLFRRFRDAGVSPLWLLSWLVPFGSFVAWAVLNIQVFTGLASNSKTLLMELDAASTSQSAMEQFFAAHPEIVNLASQLVLVLGLFLLWSLFELVVTLLPSKKEKPASVATIDY